MFLEYYVVTTEQSAHILSKRNELHSIVQNNIKLQFARFGQKVT